MEIKISPFFIDSYFISYEDSYRYGIERGTIYTPKFYNSVECAESENGPNYIHKQVLALSHEFIHLLLIELENDDTSKLFDRVDKDPTNTYYLITDLEKW